MRVCVRVPGRCDGCGGGQQCKNGFYIGLLSARDVTVVAVIRRVGTVAVAAAPYNFCVHVFSRRRVPVL